MKTFKILLFSVSLLSLLFVPSHFIWVKMVAVFWITIQSANFTFERYRDNFSTNTLTLARNTGAIIAIFSLIGSISSGLAGSQQAHNIQSKKHLNSSYIHWGEIANNINRDHCNKDDAPRKLCSSLMYILARQENNIDALLDNEYFASTVLLTVAEGQYAKAWNKVERSLSEDNHHYFDLDSKNIMKLYAFTEAFEAFENDTLEGKIYEFQTFSIAIQFALGYLLVVASALAFASEIHKERMKNEGI
ncbi:MAG: hypothetical protein JKX83_02570 [Pseudomonadales bacterium]|nr:hypothetical protein [Pseudomonadales bacterium]